MASSGVPAVPCTRSVESPEMAAARCSETQDLAVPGTPRSNNARSVTRVATATSISRREPTYFGLIIVPSDNGPPIRYRTTAQGDSRQWGGRAWSSTDRKSTRLNSSHANISYAVFCLKKKKNKHSTSSLGNETNDRKRI